VIGYCINYSRGHTQSRIERRKESPISCAKIREYFPELAETLPCHCKFKLPPSSYPSPVLYLVQSEIEQVTAASSERAGIKEESEVQMPDTGETEKEEQAEADPPFLDFEGIFSAESQEAAEDEEALEISGEDALSDLRQEAEQWLRDSEADEISEDAGERETQVFRNSEPLEINGDESTQRISPEVSDGEHEDRTCADASEAWELAVEYVRLRHAREKMNIELETISAKLEKLFDLAGTNIIQTQTGSIRREQDKAGKSRWAFFMNSE